MQDLSECVGKADEVLLRSLPPQLIRELHLRCDNVLRDCHCVTIESLMHKCRHECEATGASALFCFCFLDFRHITLITLAAANLTLPLHHPPTVRIGASDASNIYLRASIVDARRDPRQVDLARSEPEVCPERTASRRVSECDSEPALIPAPLCSPDAPNQLTNASILY